MEDHNEHDKHAVVVKDSCVFGHVPHCISHAIASVSSHKKWQLAAVDHETVKNATPW